MRTRSLDPKAVLAWMAECLCVDAVAGTMFWKKPPYNHPRMRGQQAGSERPTRTAKRYVHVKWHRTAIKRSWLIFLWVHRRWPETDCLDHIDGNSLYDGIANLREATVTQNAWNHHSRKKSSDLPMGVRTNPSGRFSARIAVNKRMIQIGTFDTPEQAASAYSESRRKYYGTFA